MLAIFMECTIFNPVLKHLVIGQFNFSSVFLCFSLDTIYRQTSYDSSMQHHGNGILHNLLVTINRQTSYDSGILCQDYGIIWGLPMDHMRFANRVTIWVVHLPKQTPVSRGALLLHGNRLCGRAVHSCNSWFKIRNLLTLKALNKNCSRRHFNF